ncbi:MAG: hemerythrin [Pseudomonas sp.]|uniref:bacteriohemerythrin n=1 Tax=Pseudomonas sp. TaxID=306 RepID=UPI001209E599|nr:hemerythrin domain-containing protein [Pseudomonas sp.]RZI76836.1 MAG: hemerythrin [Pseudomonas sp.]
MNTMTPQSLAWSDAMSLGHPLIDDEHQHLVALIARLQEAANEDLATALEAVLDAAEAHFSAENDLMTATSFPPRDCHIKEHEAVLGSLRGVARRLARGEREVVRRLAAELAMWLPAHVQHLDSALTHWLCKLQHGGKPVVLHSGGRTQHKTRGRGDSALAIA